MALSGEKKKEYNQAYYQRQKEFVWEAALRRERAMMRKVAERWMDEHPEQPPDECLLSLAYHWNQIAAEEEERVKRDRKAVEKALRVPWAF